MINLNYLSGENQLIKSYIVDKTFLLFNYSTMYPFQLFLSLNYRTIKLFHSLSR